MCGRIQTYGRTGTYYYFPVFHETIFQPFTELNQNRFAGAKLTKQQMLQIPLLSHFVKCQPNLIHLAANDASWQLGVALVAVYTAAGQHATHHAIFNRTYAPRCSVDTFAVRHHSAMS